MPMVQISLPDDLARYVEQQVSSGCYETPSDLVRDSLRLLKQDHLIENEKREVLAQAITSGLEDARMGRFSSRTATDIADELIAEAHIAP